MKLTLNKKKLKNLSKDAQVLPSDMTPNIGGGITAAATCEATTTQEPTVVNCNTDQFCNNSGVDDCDNTYFCGISAQCVSGFC